MGWSDSGRESGGLKELCAPNADARWDGCSWSGHHKYGHQGHSASIMEIVEIVLDIQGRAAAKLEMGFRNAGRDGQRYMYNMQTYAIMQTYAFICNHTLYLQLQGNTWLFSPCDALIGRLIQACLPRASFRQGWGLWICVMYFWSFRFSWKDSSPRRFRSTTEEILWRWSSIHHLWWWKSPSCCFHGINFIVENFLQRMKKISRTWAPLESG